MASGLSSNQLNLDQIVCFVCPLGYRGTKSCAKRFVKAVILAGDLGTRISEETHLKPLRFIFGLINLVWSGRMAHFLVND